MFHFNSDAILGYRIIFLVEYMPLNMKRIFYKKYTLCEAMNRDKENDFHLSDNKYNHTFLYSVYLLFTDIKKGGGLMCYM